MTTFHGINEKIYQKGNKNFLSLIELLAKFDLVMQEHVKRIKNGDLHNHYLNAKYFSIILDCTPDVSHQEQMTLILRCVDTFSSPIKIEEYFCRFFTRYDNGSNMKSKNQGVQKRLLDINPRAYYVPCGCHNLNLILCDITNSCTRAISFFGVLKCIYSLFASSTKWWKILQENLNHYLKLDGNVELKVSKPHAPKIRDTLKNYRENGFTFALESTKEITIEMDIESSSMKNEKHFDGIVSDEITHFAEDSFRVDYFLYILHKSISSTESRFEQFLEYENMFGFLFDSNKFKTLSKDELKKYFINLEKILSFEDHFDIYGLNLFSELKLFKEILTNEISTPLKILNYIKRLGSFPNT
ncbi:hypothetical protein HKD37_15G042799 [Glycine soja]